MIIAINESLDEYLKPIYSQAVIFYIHMLKWKYQPLSQSSSWVGSIKEAYEQIYYNIRKNNKNHKPFKNITRDANDQLYNAYINAFDTAINDTKLDIIRNDINDQNSVFNNFNSVELITNLEYLSKWLTSYATNKGLKYLKEQGFIL